MKLTTFILLVSLLQVSAAGFAQKITLNEKNASIEQVFKAIHNQSGYNFIYTGKLISKSNPVTINLKDASLDEALKACFTDQPLDYTIEQKTVVVKEKVTPVKPAPFPPKDVTGQVLDDKGLPLVSASVFNKRTQTGTLTDVKGNFTLKNVLATDVIRVTYIGYKPLEVTVGDKTVFNLVLKETTNGLDQVIVQAYGKTSQRFNTGDIGAVSAKEIADQPVMNPLTALQGKIPGLQVTQTSGYASAPFKVEIRGRSQLDPTMPSEPLYIIDGVPLTILESGKSGTSYATGSAGVTQNGMPGPAGGQSPLFSINPADIESISILKDAVATSIYGSRAANGVIIITTKTGKAGKTKVDASVYQGYSQIGSRFTLLNTQQYLTLRREAFKNDGITPTLSNLGTTYDLLKFDTTRYTNLQDQLWGHTGKSTDAQLALSGGDKQTTFRISGGYHRETDITTYSGASQRASVQTNLIHKSLDQKLSIGFNTNYSYANLNIIALPTGAAFLPPDIPAIYTPTGAINWSGWEPIGNPFGILLDPYSSSTAFLNSKLNISYEIIKGLSASANLGYSTMHQAQTYFFPSTSTDPATHQLASSQFGNNNNSNTIIEPQLSYEKTLGKGIFNVLLGGSYQTVLETGNKILASGYVDDNLIKSASNAPTTSAIDNNADYKYVAAFARINYNWASKYIVDISGRRDGSTRFGPGKQFGNFGAIGAAWIFTEESIFKDNLPFLSFGKLRASYGSTGNDIISDYQFLSSWASNGNQTYISGTPSYFPTRLQNPDLQWQVNKKLEAALELGFLKDRITTNLSWYRNRVGNSLVNAPLPNQTGFSSVQENLNATIQNTGIEVTVNAKIIDHNDFTWTANFNIGRNRNKLLSFPDLAGSQYANIYQIGKPLSQQRVLQYLGVDPLTGQYTFQDKNHDGVISYNYGGASDDSYFIDLQEKFEGGFGSNVKYKNWSLNLFFRFREQTVPSIFSSLASIGNSNNTSALVLNRWQKPGDNAEFSRATTNQGTSDYYAQNFSNSTYSSGSYIRLQNVALYYDLPKKLLKSIGVPSCQLSVQGENLFLITKYPGIDPDIPGFGTLPLPKTIVFGLHFSL